MPLLHVLIIFPILYKIDDNHNRNLMYSISTGELILY
jgi:hypothetical protein